VLFGCSAILAKINNYKCLLNVVRWKLLRNLQPQRTEGFLDFSFMELIGT
jgi:hypothetical protein